MQSWFQCRTHYSKSMENGKERKVNEVYLVDAILWGEAEELSKSLLLLSERVVLCT